MRWRFVFDKVSSEGDLREKVLKKLSHLGKYLKDVREDLVDGVVRIAKRSRWGYKVKMEVKLPGKEVVAEGKDKELLTAIDRAYHKVERMVRKHLERLKERG